MEVSKSKYFKDEYCITVVKIGEIKPVPNSDFLGVTLVNGEPIVVRKDQVSKGRIMLYASNESQLDKEFLSKNNLFEDPTLNADNTKKGFFDKRGRVRAIKLRGQISRGFLFDWDDLQVLNHKDPNYLLNIGTSFDTIDGRIFVKPYIPPCLNNSTGGTLKKQKKGIRKFKRIIPGEFNLHYDTQLLAKNIRHIKPEDNVVISVKMHGTSAIFANVLTRVPIKIAVYKKLWNRFVDKFWLNENWRFKDWMIDYGNVYSSRTIIKNSMSNPETTDNNIDVWGYWNNIIKEYIPKGWTIYSEIVGYVPGKNTYIQKNYDYGCDPGESHLMIYRITKRTTKGVVEMNASDVAKWTRGFIENHPELYKKVIPLPILYEGEFNDLYNAELVAEMGSDKWYEIMLESLRADKKRFGMEKDEPLCANKVPREGICLRVENDPVAECFKLKTDKFLGKEQKDIDAGNIDIEMGA